MSAQDSDESRFAIVVAVWRLIARGGIERVTFRRVAQMAGVSVGRVQHHFGTREALVRAACAAMIEGAHAQYVELSDDPIQRLRHIITHAVPDTPQARFGTSVWYAYLAHSVSDPEISQLLAETKRGTEDECVRLIEQAIGSGRLRPAPDPLAAARRLLALADGLTVRVLIGDLPGPQARRLLEKELANLEVS